MSFIPYYCKLYHCTLKKVFFRKSKSDNFLAMGSCIMRLLHVCAVQEMRNEYRNLCTDKSSAVQWNLTDDTWKAYIVVIPVCWPSASLYWPSALPFVSCILYYLFLSSAFDRLGESSAAPPWILWIIRARQKERVKGQETLSSSGTKGGRKFP